MNPRGCELRGLSAPDADLGSFRHFIVVKAGMISSRYRGPNENFVLVCLGSSGSLDSNSP